MATDALWEMPLVGLAVTLSYAPLCSCHSRAPVEQCALANRHIDAYCCVHCFPLGAFCQCGRNTPSLWVDLKQTTG